MFLVGFLVGVNVSIFATAFLIMYLRKGILSDEKA